MFSHISASNTTILTALTLSLSHTLSQDGQALYCDIPSVLQLKKRDADAKARAHSKDFARPCKVCKGLNCEAVDRVFIL